MTTPDQVPDTLGATTIPGVPADARYTSEAELAGGDDIAILAALVANKMATEHYASSGFKILRARDRSAVSTSRITDNTGFPGNDPLAVWPGVADSVAALSVHVPVPKKDGSYVDMMCQLRGLSTELKGDPVIELWAKSPVYIHAGRLTCKVASIFSDRNHTQRVGYVTGGPTDAVEPVLRRQFGVPVHADHPPTHTNVTGYRHEANTLPYDAMLRQRVPSFANAVLLAASGYLTKPR